VATLLHPGLNRRGRNSNASYLPKFARLRLKVKVRFLENPSAFWVVVVLSPHEGDQTAAAGDLKLVEDGMEMLLHHGYA
jgi:hypothetical protein